jgi:hypothetical protein
MAAILAVPHAVEGRLGESGRDHDSIYHGNSPGPNADSLAAPSRGRFFDLRRARGLRPAPRTLRRDYRNLRVSSPIKSVETAVEVGAECNASDGVRSLLTSANPDGLFDRHDKDLTVPDLVRAR